MCTALSRWHRLADILPGTSSPGDAGAMRRRFATLLLALASFLAGVVPGRLAAQDDPPPVHHDPFHDRANPAYETLQKAEAALAGFPADPKGLPDWMKMLEQGLIQPRAELTGPGKMEVLDLDIIMKNTKDMPWVRFPHRSHTLWLACRNCHDGIFIAKAGANAIDMNKIFRGQFCGTCHDRVAFMTVFACHRCHSVAHGDIKPWWTSQ